MTLATLIVAGLNLTLFVAAAVHIHLVVRRWRNVAKSASGLLTNVVKVQQLQQAAKTKPEGGEE